MALKIYTKKIDGTVEVLGVKSTTSGPAAPQSSNKNQTLPDFDHTPIMNDLPAEPEKVNAPFPFIDKIAVVLSPKTAGLAAEIHSWLYQDLLNDSNDFKTVSKPLKGFKRAKLIYLSDYEERPRIDYAFTVTPSGTLAERVRIEFNPSKLGVWGLKALHGVLSSIIPGGWQLFISDGKITRLDVAVDLVGVRVSKLLMQPPTSQATTAWSNAKGKLETYQWGQAKGSHTQIYNKTAEQFKKGVVLPGPQVTRVERRLKPPACKQLSLLAEMDNPFAGIVLTTHVPEAPAGGPEYVWPMFCDSVKVRGLDGALKLLSKNKAKKTAFRQQFKKATPPWWNPDAIWANWPAALSALGITSKLD